MKTASHALTSEQIQELEEAITSAEQNTSGEIVPVIATCSGHYHHANMMVGFIFSLIAFATLWYMTEMKLGSTWSGDHVLSVGLPIFLCTEIAAFILGLLVAGLIPQLKLLFISPKEMQQEVTRAAHQAFFNLHVAKTHASTGVVIYISLFEHIVCVQGDTAISEKLSQEEWQSIKDLVIDDIKKNQLAYGLKKAILEMGVLLTKHFPATSNNANELHNKVYLLD
jgi:putative membrane protein